MLYGVCPLVSHVDHSLTRLYGFFSFMFTGDLKIIDISIFFKFGPQVLAFKALDAVLRWRRHMTPLARTSLCPKDSVAQLASHDSQRV